VNAARSAFASNDSASAKRYYTSIKSEVEGEAKAEATYHLALFDHIGGKYEGSNEQIFWMMENLPTYPKWRWNSLLLMAKNYAALHDDFQANYTLDFIIENSSIVDLQNEAAAYKAELALQREREAQQTLILDTLVEEETKLEETFDNE
jgi:hypothetical protein